MPTRLSVEIAHRVKYELTAESCANDNDLHGTGVIADELPSFEPTTRTGVCGILGTVGSHDGDTRKIARFLVISSSIYKKQTRNCERVCFCSRTSRGALIVRPVLFRATQICRQVTHIRSSFDVWGKMRRPQNCGGIQRT
jgi:hypothetical protein